MTRFPSVYKPTESTKHSALASGPGAADSRGFLEEFISSSTPRFSRESRLLTSRGGSHSDQLITDSGSGFTIPLGPYTPAVEHRCLMHSALSSASVTRLLPAPTSVFDGKKVFVRLCSRFSRICFHIVGSAMLSKAVFQLMFISRRICNRSWMVGASQLQCLGGV